MDMCLLLIRSNGDTLSTTTRSGREAKFLAYFLSRAISSRLSALAYFGPQKVIFSLLYRKWFIPDAGSRRLSPANGYQRSSNIPNPSLCR